MTHTAPPDSRYFIEALRRGINILEAFDRDSPWLGLIEIAEKVELDKSTVFRFVYTLEQLGYLERNPETKKYRPGLKVLNLGFTLLHNLGIVELAQPYLKRVHEQCGETVNMTVREGDEIVYVARVGSSQIVSVNLSIGSRLPVHCTAMGKVQLIDMPQDALAALLGPEPYRQMTPKTVTTLGGLLADLEEARARGYGLNDEELAVGLRSVAAPIRGSGSEIVAAINISVPSMRVTRRELKTQLAPLITDAARTLSAALGATPST